jgi:hypothetical protein
VVLRIAQTNPVAVALAVSSYARTSSLSRNCSLIPIFSMEVVQDALILIVLVHHGVKHYSVFLMVVEPAVHFMEVVAGVQ